MRTVDLGRYIHGHLRRNTQGIWQIPEASGPVAYPDSGNRLYQEVEDTSWWFSHRQRVILTTVRRFPPAGMLWDIGGGNGALSAALQKGGFACALLEAGSLGCQNARRRGVRTVIQGRIEDIRFRESSLEAVGLFDVLEHAPNPDELLRRLSKALARGGKGLLYVTVPAHSWLWSGEDVWAGHFRRYSLKPLLAQLQEHGFRPLHHTYFFSWLSPPIFLARVLPSRLGRRPEGAGRPNLDWRAEKIWKDHRPLTGPAGRLFERHLAAEARTLEQGRISHGSSLLAVCCKP